MDNSKNRLSDPLKNGRMTKTFFYMNNLFVVTFENDLPLYLMSRFTISQSDVNFSFC